MVGLGYPSTVTVRSARVLKRFLASTPNTRPRTYRGAYCTLTFVISVHVKRRLLITVRSVTGWRTGFGVQGSGAPTMLDQPHVQRFQRSAPRKPSDWRRSHESGVSPIGVASISRVGP